jgi:hypothetical protein
MSSYEYKYGYLRGVIQSAMLLRNVQQMKDVLGDALEYVGENETFNTKVAE